MRTCALVLLALLASPVLAQQEIVTQPVVSSLIPIGDVVHILTQAVDANYNGTQDSGDVPAQWMIVDRSTFQTRSTIQFPWGVTTAPRVGVDSLTGLMFIGILDTVWAYTTATQQRSATPVYVGLCSALYYDAQSSSLYISQRPSFDSPGTIVILDVATLQSRTIGADVNPQQTLVYRDAQNKATSITVCDGTFGQNNGSLVFIDQDGSSSSLTIGETPNHMAIDEVNNLLYVVMNGEHAVKVVNLSSQQVVATWPVGTSGFDGPREIAIDNRWAYVTTYAGTLVTIDRITGSINNTITLPAKADPVVALDNAIWVGLSYQTGTYIGTGNVVIYPASAASVATLTPSFYSAAQAITLSTLEYNKPITLRNLQGAEVRCTYVPEQRLLDIRDVSPGTYIASDGRNGVLLCVAPR